jgi:aminotransferase
MTDEEFCERLLHEERVAMVPGSAFGASGDGFVRASYAVSEDNICRALERLERFLQHHGLLMPALAY